MNLQIIFLAVCAFLTNEVLSQEVVAELQCDSPIDYTSFGIVYRVETCRLDKKLTGALQILVDADKEGCVENHLSHGVSQGYIYFRVTGGCKMHIRIVRKEGTYVQWSEWTPWSSCSSRCSQARTRTCSTGDVSDCNGDAEETKACTGGACQNLAFQEGCGLANTRPLRVLGGQEAFDCEFPWMVYITVTRPNGRKSQCAGSIVDNLHVLTTAKCVSRDSSTEVHPVSRFTVYAGTFERNSQQGTQHKVESIVSHENFSRSNFANDIAVIKLRDPIKFDGCHRPICLPQSSANIEIQDLKRCKAMGWGRTSNTDPNVSKNLMWTPQEPTTENTCTTNFGRRPGTLCAGGSSNNGVCFGDSGAPLVCQAENLRYYHYGIASLIKAGNCGSKPGLYTNILDFLPWIKKALGNGGGSEPGATWGAWTSWSSCNRECKETRTRTCNFKNGFVCQGDARETKDCSGGACQNQNNLGECGLANSQNGRVVGGSTAKECEFPWMVLVSASTPFSSGSSVCGGSIIDNRHILTAAHCVIPKGRTQVYPLSYFTISSGTSSPFVGRSTRHAVERVFPHQAYNGLYISNDVAVIRLRDPITFDRCHRPICMFGDNEYIQVQNLQTCRVMGWGLTSNARGSRVSRNLMWAPQIAASNSECVQAYGRRTGVLCARGTGSGSCSGDSGGPLTCQHSNGRFYQYGIVSAGFPNQCGISQSLYTDVNYFRNWIKQQVATP